MKKTIAKSNETKSCFFENIKLTKLEPDSAKKRRGLKSLKLGVKKEKLQLIPHKYKGS